MSVKIKSLYIINDNCHKMRLKMIFFYLFLIHIININAELQKYVFNTFCCTDGIGSWLERHYLPIAFNKFCPKFKPIFKSCDFIGHNNRLYDHFLGQTINQTIVDGYKNSSSTVVKLDYHKNLRNQFEKINCTYYENFQYVYFNELLTHGVIGHTFNDIMTFKLQDKYAVKLENKFVIRVGIHYRAGDVFHGGHHSVDFRSIPLDEIKNVTEKILKIVDGKIQVLFYCFTELSIQHAITAYEKLPNVFFFFDSDDEFSQIALASQCDILVLCYSAFSWFISLFNPESLKILYKTRIKYDYSKNTVKYDEDYTTHILKLIEEKKQKYLN